MDQPRFLRRRAAAKYLTETYGFGSYQTLCKGAVTGDTPIYRKVGKLVVYEKDALDRWAMSKLGEPRRSTSDAEAA